MLLSEFKMFVKDKTFYMSETGHENCSWKALKEIVIVENIKRMWICFSGVVDMRFLSLVVLVLNQEADGNTDKCRLC